MKTNQHKTSLATVIKIIIIFSMLIAIYPVQILAERLESDSFVIQFGNFNVTSGEKESASFKVTDTVGQTAAGPFGEYGSSSYFVGAGFQYIYQIGEFRFSISDLDIDLGLLTPGSHNSDSNILTISTKGASGYSIYSYEAHPLKHLDASYTIPDTTCDNASCSESQAEIWTNQDIPGFGFNIAGVHVSSDFVDSSYFRQFADKQSSEDAQLIMSSSNIGLNDQATVTYKAGISGNQASGNYQTHIVYIAIPGY